MAKFGKKKTMTQRAVKTTTTLATRPDATINYEGGLAFNYTDAKLELFTLIMSCLFNEPKFYGKTGTTEKRIVELVQKLAPENAEFLLRLAKYARKEGNLRSVSTALMVEVANAVKNINAKLSQKERTSLKFSVRPFVPQIVQRADEITEALAYYTERYDDINKMPLALKRGLSDAFDNFSTYQLLKYDREGEFSLGDAINILHPHTDDAERRALYTYLRGWDFDKEVEATIKRIDSKQSVLVKKTIDNEVLEAVSKGDITWEVFISHFGSNKESWNAIAPYMPYMATLRNLRNFLENGVTEENLKKVAAKLSNEKAVLNSKQFPFRFQSALASISTGSVRVPSYITKALSDALAISVNNLPKIGGVTAIFSDNSGSMHNSASAKSTVQMIDIAALMSAIAFGFSDDAMVGAFGQTFKFVNLNPTDSILTNMDKVRRADVGHSTEAHLAIRALTDKKLKVDRMFIFSDMQCYDSGSGYGYGYSRSLAVELKEYRRRVNPNVKVYSFDLRGYGTAQFPSDDKNVVTLAGFSEKIFKFMEIFESSDASILDVIAKY